MTIKLNNWQFTPWACLFPQLIRCYSGSYQTFDQIICPPPSREKRAPRGAQTTLAYLKINKRLFS